MKHQNFEMALIGDEKKEDFEALLKGFNVDLKPTGVTEESLVLQLAQVEWRRRRMARLEAEAVQKAIDTGDTECKFMDTSTAYTQRLTREFQSALKTLRGLQEKRLKRN